MQFYFHPSPNPMKIALALEEMDLAYELVPVDTFKGEQHRAEFLALNPNAKVPVIVNGTQTVFDSNAILIYLANKTGRFQGTADQQGELMSWLMFIATGVGPYSGQAVHFMHHAPEKLPYAVKRYAGEVSRHYEILDKRLASRPYLIGDDYTIADMALWGWANFLPYVTGERGYDDIPNVKRLFDEISARPAAARAHALKSRITLKSEIDEEARRALFPVNYRT